MGRTLVQAFRTKYGGPAGLPRKSIDLKIRNRNSAVLLLRVELFSFAQRHEHPPSARSEYGT